MRLAVVIAISLVALGAFVRPLVTDAKSRSQAGQVPAAEAASPVIAPSSRITEFRGTEGFWRIGKTADGVWWFVSPEGRPEFLNTVTTVVPFQHGRDPNGAHYVSRDWLNSGDELVIGDDAGSAALQPGDLDEWATRTLARVRGIGFKGLGAWCHPVFHNHGVPITRDLNLWTWVSPDARRFYSRDWAAAAEAAVIKQVTPLRENRNLVGYFLDNELDWGDGGSGPGHYFDFLPVGDPNRSQVLGVIKKLWPSVEEFNRDWNANFDSYDDLAAADTLPLERGDAYGRLLSAWLEKLARDYFELTTRLVRAHDPNHLVLGVRFKAYAPPEVVRASRGLTDVQSLNYYVADGVLDPEMFAMMTRESDQPVMITEYSFHSLDGRSGNRNAVGFSAQVVDQRARADGYRQFTTRLARVPYIIGADWFQWSDEPPSGRRVDGEDVNFGMVDVDDHEYADLAAAVRDVTPKLNDFHSLSHADRGETVWRESFADLPSIEIPYLATPPRLNGELSDWAPATRIQNVRQGKTIGVDRANRMPPVVTIGWNEAGLWLGFEVRDDDIQAAPASGWWWTRDNVEFWISTRPVSSDQVRYDANSHQFFFVPMDLPGPGGAGGVVGQWHRPGDSLTDHLIPHPKVKSATRVLPDRYVVEMFIPADALHGFDPATTQHISFNFHVRDFHHAVDFFWSAPKEVMTQLRPNTWGIARLQRPLTAFKN